MKASLTVAVVLGFLLVVIGLVTTFSGRHEHDPTDLLYWVRTGATNDWSSAAAHGEARAQFHVGVSLIRTNLVVMMDRVPGLSALPLVGRRYFEKITYSIDGNISQEQLAAACQWIQSSAEQGFAPAKEAEKLFIERIAKTNKPVQRTEVGRSTEETNSAPSAADSAR